MASIRRLWRRSTAARLVVFIVIVWTCVFFFVNKDKHGITLGALKSGANEVVNNVPSHQFKDHIDDSNMKQYGFLVNPMDRGAGLPQPGENGQPVVLGNLTGEKKKLVDDGWQKNAFNQYVSDLISLDRSLPEVTLEG